MPAFNLIDEPWIPCVMPNGEAREIGLRDALNSAHQVREVFDSSPLVTAALHRLLLSIVQRNFAPGSLVEWKALWSTGRLDDVKLNDYFIRWHARFDLFHAERPFYQQAKFKAKKTTPLKRLGWEFAAGNNATLFDHSWDEDRPAIPPATAARWVIATQTFAASAGKSETLHTKDSPWTRGAVILMQGNNLFETLALNLLSLLKPDFPSFADDCLVWELEETWNPAHGLTPSGKLSYLTWQSRSIRLLPANDGGVRECYFAQGRALQEEWRGEPMFAYKRNAKQGLLVWQFNPDRAVWRDSHALFNLSLDAPFQVPQALAHIATIAREGVVDRHRLYQLQILGQCLESGQPTIHFWRQERLPVRVEYLDNSLLLERLGEALRLAEDCARSLEQSLWSLAKLLVATNSDHKEARQPDKKDIKNIIDSFGASPHYWAQLDAPFKQLLIDLPSDKTEEYGEVIYGESELPRWAGKLQRTATSALAVATRSLDNSSRALKAVAKAEPSFRAKLREILADYLKQTAANGRSRMSTKEKELRPEERFVAYLQRLVDEEDRAPLASLRRGLGKAPGEAAEVLRYVLPRMPQNASRWDEDAYFLVATLFALHQINWPSSKDSTQATNLGASFARLGREVESESIEKRFVALLNCHQDDLPTHLRHAVSLLKSKEIPIDWARLLRDVRGWNHADRYVQRNWARAFWANSAAAEQPSSDQSNQEVNETTPPAKGEN